MDTNRINEINASVHQSSDLDGALSVYNLLKSNGYEIKSTMGALMDYCKTRGIDRVRNNVELLVRYDEELAKKESVTKAFYTSIYSGDKSGSLDRIEELVKADTKYNIETDARYHDNSKPDNGKSIFTMRMEELKAKIGGDNVSSKLDKARKSLEENYAAFRNLTAEDLKSTKAMKLRESIDQNRYYINQLEGMSSKNSYSIDSVESINAFSADVKELYNFINSLKLNDDTRKALIDEFAALRTKINDYRNYIVNLQSAGKKYDALLAEMNVVKSKSSKKSEVKAGAPTETKPVEPKKKPEEEKKPEPKPSDDQIDLSTALSPGDIVTFNGKSSSVADVGMPIGLVKGQGYKVEKIVIFRGLSYAKLEGIDNLVDTVCLDKVIKKDMPEPSKGDEEKKEPEKKVEEKGNPIPEPTDEPKPEPTSGDEEDKKGEEKTHDYKVKRVREVVGNLLPIACCTAAIIGIGTTASLGVSGVLLCGALSSMAIGYCISHNIRLPKFKKLKEKFIKKLPAETQDENGNDNESKLTEDEANDAKMVVNEIENAERDMLIENLKSDRLTDEELKEQAKEYVKAGKLKPEILDADRKTINDAIVDLIIAEYKEPEQTKGNEHTL